MGQPVTPETAVAAGQRYGLVAFGLVIESDWLLPGAHPVGASPGVAANLTSVRAVSSEEFREEWEKPSVPVFEPEYPDGRRRVEITRTESHYLLWFDHYGRYTVAVDGTEVVCDADSAPRVFQERFLFAQALPLAAVLSGLELIHGSAVVVGDGVAAFVGPSGVGKTTLASRLVMRGATLMTDDVLAIEPTELGMLAHPGSPMMVVVPEDGAPANGMTRLGPSLGQSDKLHVSVPTAAGALPLTALYHLERSESLAVTALEEPDVRRLLGTVFVPYLTTPGRLRRHLEMAQLLSDGVDQFRLQVPGTSSFEHVLDSVEAHLGERRGGC